VFNQVKEIIMEIQFYRKNVYGREMMYLIKSRETESMLKLMGTLTINKEQIAEWSRLGFDFEEVLAP